MSTLSSKDERDDRDAVLGDRPHEVQAGQAAHGHLDGLGDELLDLQGRQARRPCHDLDLDVGHVREGVDGQGQEGVDPDPDEEGQDDEDEGPLPEGKGDDLLDHHFSPSSVPLSISALTSKLPSVTTFSPSLSPSRIST